MSDWWEKYIYLRSRAPLLINSNYYGLGYAYHVPSNVQTARASIIAHYFAHFKILLESERLAPTTMRGKYLFIIIVIVIISTIIIIMIVIIKSLLSPSALRLRHARKYF